MLVRMDQKPEAKVKNSRRITGAALSVLLLLGASACSDSGSGNGPQGNGGTDGSGAAGENRTRALQTIGNQEEFENSVRDALAAYYQDRSFGTNQGSSNEDSLDAGAPAPVASPESAGDTGGTTGGGDTGGTGSTADLSVATDGGTDFTGTNVQEVGVDEADRVKSDGSFLYVLNTNNGSDVGITDGLPVPETDDIASTSVPYYPPTAASIKILELDASNADAIVQSELSIELGTETAGGLYLFGGSGTNGDDAQLVMTSTSFGYSYWGSWNEPVQWQGASSSIRKISINDRQNPSPGDSLTLRGTIVSSRVVGDYLYLASRFFPMPVYVDPYAQDLPLRDALENAEFSDLMPQITRASDGLTVPLANADNCFVAASPDNGYYSPDIVTLAVINLSDLSLSDSVCYLGASETLYASTNAAYIATTEYDYGHGGGGTDGGFEPEVEPLPADPSTPDAPSVEGGDSEVEPDVERPVTAPDEPVVIIEPYQPPVPITNIHQFDFVDGRLAYRGSGSVTGHLGWNPDQRPFRMSEKDGYLRVATYNDSNEFWPVDGATGGTGGIVDSDQSASSSPVYVSILAPSADQQLDVIARIPNDARPAHIGKPREQLYASRFLGDRAYLVTFRQTDPLYVVDLSNPSDPYVAGELEIEGYSDYLHPVGENHLLGIGKGAIPDQFGDGNRGAFFQGVKLSLFDVANPAAPSEIQSIEIGRRGSESNALRDHHGFTFRPSTDGQPARLAVSIDVHDIPPPFDYGPATWYNWRESGLHTFNIDTSGNPGITQVGRMIVEAASPQRPWGPIRGNDRSVLVDDAVFYIHGEQVFGANWYNLGGFNGPR